eukprot:COSAG03_NODE_17558_length_372_cov_20.897436_1_plen_31_part_01
MFPRRGPVTHEAVASPQIAIAAGEIYSHALP